MGLCQIKQSKFVSQVPSVEENQQQQEDSDEETEETTQIPLSNEKKLSLEDFHLLKVIGRGSFGKVLLVRKLDDQKIYAVKVLRKSLLTKKKQKSQAIQERTIMSILESEYTVKLHFAFQSASRLYLVMDFMIGGELFIQLRRKQKFSEEDTQFYAAELVIALEWLHSQNIIYRDLKPENILIDKNGHLVLTDFGLSKLGYEQNQVSYSFCGTPEYVAPEILYQKGHTKTVDFYSLGALIYEMLSGAPPFYSKDKREMLKNRCEKPLEMKSGFSMATQSLLKGLLMKNPELRLGNNGIGEIKRHSFFFGVDWEAMRNRTMTPPFIPKVRNSEDLTYFSQAFTTQVVADTLESRMDENFEGFSYKITNN